MNDNDRQARISFLEGQKRILKDQVQRIDDELKPLLIEAYQAKTGLEPGCLITAAGFGFTGKVFRVKELIVSSSGIVRPKGNQFLRGGEVLTFAQEIFGTPKKLTEVEALEMIRKEKE